MNPDVFESDDMEKSCPVSHRTINRHGSTTYGPSFSRLNPDTIGCLWTGDFDFHPLHVNGAISDSGKIKLRIQKYPDTCGPSILGPVRYYILGLSVAKHHCKVLGRKKAERTTKFREYRTKDFYEILVASFSRAIFMLSAVKVYIFKLPCFKAKRCYWAKHL